MKSNVNYYIHKGRDRCADLKKREIVTIPKIFTTA